MWVDYSEHPVYGLVARVGIRTATEERVNCYFTGVEPWGFVPEDEDLPERDWIVDVEHGYESIFDEPLKKVVTTIPKKVNSRSDDDTLADYVSEHFEADIPMYRKLAMVDGISSYVELPDEPEETFKGVNVYSFDNVDVDVDPDFVIPPRIMLSDIEVRVGDEDFEETRERACQPINVICSYDSYAEDFTVFFYDKHDSLNSPSRIRDIVSEQWDGDEPYDEYEIVLRKSETEEDMANDFINYIVERDFDLTSGWNWIDFDYQYLYDRFDRLEDVDVGRMSPFGSGSYVSNDQMRVRGLPAFDLMEAFCSKMTFTGWRSKSLDYVSNEELGVGKVDDVDINKDWKHNPEKLIGYNIVDVILTVALDAKNDIHSFFYEMADASAIPIYDTFYEKRIVDGYIISRRRDFEILPSATEEDTPNAGGYVADSVNGRHRNIGVADLKSLYPSAIITGNISTETIAETPEAFDEYVRIPHVPEPKEVEGQIEEGQIEWDWLYCSMDKEGIIPRILKKLFNKRNREKKRMYEAETDEEESKWNRKQGATKVIMNCFTGDTELVTPDGVRNIKDIKPGEKVYSIDPDSYDVEIKTVVDTTKGDNLYGEVEHITSNRMDQRITKNHKVLTEEDGLTEYQNLENGEYSVPNHNSVGGGRQPDFFDIVEEGWIDEGRIWLDYKEHGRTFKQKLPNEVSENIVNSKNRGEYRLDDLDIYREYSVEIRSVSENVSIQHDDKHGSIPVVYNSESFIKLIGWFITEGSCYSDNRTNSKSIQIAQKTQPGIDKIKSCLRECGLSINFEINGFVVGSTPIYNLMEKLCGDGSYNKCIPEFIFELNYELRDILWDTLMLGDGSEIGEFQRYSTASDELKDDVCRLLVLQGWQPQVRRDSGVWRIQKSDGTKFSTERTSTEEHEDKVYCVTLEDNHTVLAGRNGKFSWIGQSFYGNASSPYWRMSNEYLGDAITSFSRYTLWKGRISIENMGYEAIYGDTDSQFIQLKEDELEKQIEELERIAEKMDEDASEIAQEIGIDGEHPFLVDAGLHGDEHTCMMWEPEKIYRVWLQLGKKKRYAGNIDWKEGEVFADPEISISGFENRRSDSPEITGELQEEIIRKILTDKTFDEVSSYIQDIVDQIDEEHEDVKRFALPGAINKDLEDYPNRQVPRACIWSNEHLDKQFVEGDDPFVYLIQETPSGLPQSDVLALEWKDDIPEGFELDKEAIIERAVRKPIASIIEEMDWKFNELRSGRSQVKKDLSSGGENPFA